MELVQVPEKSYGNFFEGDCYILLAVSVGHWVPEVQGHPLLLFQAYGLLLTLPYIGMMLKWVRRFMLLCKVVPL